MCKCREHTVLQPLSPNCILYREKRSVIFGYYNSDMIDQKLTNKSLCRTDWAQRAYRRNGRRVDQADNTASVVCRRKIKYCTRREVDCSQDLRTTLSESVFL